MSVPLSVGTSITAPCFSVEVPDNILVASLSAGGTAHAVCLLGKQPILVVDIPSLGKEPALAEKIKSGIF